MKLTCLKLFASIFAFVFLLAGGVVAQESREYQSDDCGYILWNGGDRSKHHYEVREQTLPATGRIAVDGRTNGGVQVRGWDQGEVLVRACVQTWDERGAAAARERAAQVRIETSGDVVRAVSTLNPDEALGGSVSYKIYVPRNYDLALKTHNGGISINDVAGRIELDAHNGGISLARVGGEVSGGTTNGGLYIALNGDRWQGAGLDVRTKNGGVKLVVPENYSARLETGTKWGGFKIDHPAITPERNSKRLAIELGAGGTLVRAVTTNGGVSVTTPKAS